MSVIPVILNRLTNLNDSERFTRSHRQALNLEFPNQPPSQPKPMFAAQVMDLSRFCKVVVESVYQLSITATSPHLTDLPQQALTPVPISPRPALHIFLLKQ